MYETISCEGIYLIFVVKRMPKVEYISGEFYAPVYLFGHKTKYVVSTEGVIYNTETNKPLIPETTNRGYQRVLIYYNGKRKHYAVHRLVAETYLPNPKQYPEVNHKNGDKTNNTVYNLEWCTASYNVRHSYDTGLNYAGEKNSNASMSNEVAQKIAQCLAENKLTITEISNLTDVSRRAIRHILKGENWRRVVTDYDFSNYDVYDCRYARKLQNTDRLLTEYDSRLLRGAELRATTKYTTEEIAKMLGLSEDEVREHCTRDNWCFGNVRNGSMVVHGKRSAINYEKFKAEMMSR